VVYRSILGVGALFLVLSVLTLCGKGTFKVTDSGVYGIVHHPMYLRGLVMFLSYVFFGQNWITAINTVIGVIGCYLIILSGDERNIEKFGEEYVRYMQKVPRMNLVDGILRLARRGKKL